MNKNKMIEAREEDTLSVQENKSAEDGAQKENAADLRSGMKALEERCGEMREELRKAQEEAQKLREENAILKQNAANAAKAPVKGAAHGPVGETRKDPFLEGFFGED